MCSAQLENLTQIESVYGDNCQIQGNGNYWNLDSLTGETQAAVNIGNSSSIYVQLCGGIDVSAVLALNNSCSSLTSSYSVIALTLGNGTLQCDPLVSTSTSITWYMLNSSNASAGLVANWNNPSSPNATVTMYIECLAGATNMTYNNATATYGADFNNITIYANSEYACTSFSPSLIWSFVGKYEFLFVPVFIIMGLFVCFFGLKMFRPTLFIAATVACFFALLVFFFAVFVTYTTTDSVKIVLFLVAILPSLGVGWLILKAEKVGVFLLGAWLGILGGFILYDAIISHFKPGTAVLYVVIAVCGIAAGAIGVWLEKGIVIFSTSFLGSYATVRAVGQLIGNYPNEFLVVQNIEQYGNPEVGWQFYVYMVMIFLLAVFGCVFQIKTKKEEEDKLQDDTDPSVYLNANLPFR
jgi:hypothetical protein